MKSNMNKTVDFSAKNNGKSKNFALLRDISGQGMIEYILLVLVVAVGSLGAMKLMGKHVTASIRKADRQIQEVNQLRGSNSSGASSEESDDGNI